MICYTQNFNRTSPSQHTGGGQKMGYLVHKEDNVNKSYVFVLA